MSDKPGTNTTSSSEAIPFKAETRQLLDILIHSLYTEREIFLRELISNASDALTRMDFQMLTDRNVVDPDVELAIRIIPDTEEKTLTIVDTGVGMTAEELAENLGTIAHSGAQAFVQAASKGDQKVSDIIGQFGVGFYSAFMVAEWIRVISRSYLPDATPATWYSTGAEDFRIEEAEKKERGTSVVIKLKEDALEFLQESRLREIVHRHSDFVAFPIYIADGQEQINRRTAIWRQNPRQVDEKEYNEFYRQMTLDTEEPLAHAHLVVDAPVQMYAVLFIPSREPDNILSLRKDYGLQLFSHKVLIQEYCHDLLPEYLRFVVGVVDSEDLPLNVSRETVQANRAMAQLKKLVTGKVIETLKSLSTEKPQEYRKFWENLGQHVKEGVAVEPEDVEAYYPLLRFHTTTHADEWSSLDDYLSRAPLEQKEIYYILSEDPRAVAHSPHLDYFHKHNLEVLELTDPVDPFMLLRLTRYKDHELINVASSDLKLPEVEEESQEEPSEEQENLTPAATTELLRRFKARLGERVADVRAASVLSASPARLVDPQGAPTPELQQVYRLLKQEFETPKKVLEINPRHPILQRLAVLAVDDPLSGMVIEQIYDDALLAEGQHPDPAGMISRIQELIEAALKKNS